MNSPLGSNGAYDPGTVAENDEKLSKSKKFVVASQASSAKWRKGQLDSVAERFRHGGAADDRICQSNNDENTVGREGADMHGTAPVINSDDDLQQMWRDMESRVLNRRSLTAAERGGRVGRRNVRKSDEDVWLEAGVYDHTAGAGSDGGSGNGAGGK